MTEERLLKIKEIILAKKDEIESSNAKLRRIKELEQTSDVKEYMQLRHLQEIPSVQRQLDDSVYYKAFNVDTKDGYNDTNGIYLCVGNGRYLSGFKIKEYRTYINIESLGEKMVCGEHIEPFEQNHIIIRGKKLSEIQIEFIKQAVSDGQEEAVKQMAKKYKGSNK